MFRPKLNVSIYVPNYQDVVKESNQTLESCIIKELLDWCYENAFISEMKRPGRGNDNLFLWACEKGFQQIVEYLWRDNNRFIDVNCFGSLGTDDETPLHKPQNMAG